MIRKYQKTERNMVFCVWNVFTNLRELTLYNFAITCYKRDPIMYTETMNKH